MLDDTGIIDEYVIGPQAGPQTDFLATSADIAIYGGAAGGGKTHGLLLEAARHIDNPNYGGVIFRRESVQITSEGGLLDTSFTLYNNVGGRIRLSPVHQWSFESGATITFSHLHNEKDVNNWQGSQIPLIGYDELTHFTEKQFWYMLSRNRSTCGVQPYIRATCNPDADSWVAELIAWWIDQETGYPIQDRSGVVRWFIRREDKMIWGNSRQEIVAKYPGSFPKSLTFIPATLEDNKILNKADPNYRANLEAMTRVERERLLRGNWKIRPSVGSYFPRIMVTTLEVMPTDVKTWVRRFDLAATEPSETNPDPDSTCGVLMGKRANGRFVIADVVYLKKNAHVVREAIKNIVQQDKARITGPWNTRIGSLVTVIPQDPGSAGKDQAQSYITFLAGHNVKAVRETGPKITRAEPLSAQWCAGNVDIVAGPWNKEFLTELEWFPEGAHDDGVDAASGAFYELTFADANLQRWKALSS